VPGQCRCSQSALIEGRKSAYTIASDDPPYRISDAAQHQLQWQLQLGKSGKVCQTIAPLKVRSVPNVEGVGAPPGAVADVVEMVGGVVSGS